MFALTGAVIAAAVGNSVLAGGRTEALPKLSDTSAEAVALQVDGLIQQSLVEQDAVPAARSTDEDFLRRASLDLTGRIPTPEAVTLFGLTPGDEKRAEAINRMLDDPGFSQTWASYWREVIFSRATDMRSRRSQGVFEEWLTEQLAANRPWDAIVTELLTATGDTSEDGRTALIFAHGGDATELAAETSRIFLGIQIQCANCHDHPYDSWKRKDFHELAAFFPRIRVRRNQDGEKRTFVVESADNARDNDGPPVDLEQAFRFLDRNRDGKLTVEETKRNPRFGKLLTRLVKQGDKDSDGALSKAELKDLPMRPQNQPGRGSAEYYMPDLEDPAARGTRTEPVSFIDERSVPFGTKDVDRRAALAESIVAPGNPWFARAFVNRIWAEMLGEGFYAPIDDMGPQRTAKLPEVLDTLAAGFVANQYDIKWLYGTIALTEAYQRTMPGAEASGEIPAFAAMSPTRLRGDQIYNAVTQILGVEKLGGRRMAGGPGMRGMSRNDGGRGAFAALFNYDPSTPQDDLMGNIPQALFMMNSQVTNGAVNGRGGTVLARTLLDFEDDSAALGELYLRVLSREPTAAELEICRHHIADIGNRTEAFEDIMWSLMNSSEFLTKR
ncbi:MAG: DUF1549 domain-containing protein [Planctomycetaceae bacterium]